LKGFAAYSNNYDTVICLYVLKHQDYNGLARNKANQIIKYHYYFQRKNIYLLMVCQEKEILLLRGHDHEEIKKTKNEELS